MQALNLEPNRRKKPQIVRQNITRMKVLGCFAPRLRKIREFLRSSGSLAIFMGKQSDVDARETRSGSRVGFQRIAGQTETLGEFRYVWFMRSNHFFFLSSCSLAGNAIIAGHPKNELKVSPEKIIV